MVNMRSSDAKCEVGLLASQVYHYAVDLFHWSMNIVSLSLHLEKSLWTWYKLL